MVTEKGIVLLSINPEAIVVRLQQYDSNLCEEILNIENNNEKDQYSLIGLDENNIFLCKSDFDGSWIEILQLSGINIKVLHHHEGYVQFDLIKPVKIDDKIYYFNSEGIHEYNLIDNTNKIIAKTLLRISLVT